MKVFEDLDIEFFDLKSQKPINGESVIIVIKDSSLMDKSTYNKPALTGKKAITKATYKEYKTRPCKFTDTSQYFVVNFTEDEIVCWAKLKDNGNT